MKSVFIMSVILEKPTAKTPRYIPHYKILLRAAVKTAAPKSPSAIHPSNTPLKNSQCHTDVFFAAQISDSKTPSTRPFPMRPISTATTGSQAKAQKPHQSMCPPRCSVPQCTAFSRLTLTSSVRRQTRMDDIYTPLIAHGTRPAHRTRP